MALKLVKRQHSPFWYIRGTVRGSIVFESTKTADRAVADDVRIKREGALLQRSVHGAKAVASFIEAAVSYMEVGGERRFIGPLIEHFGKTPLAQIDQTAIDRCVRLLYPDAAPSTVNRHVHTPCAAVMHHAAKRGLCDWIRIERPKQPEGRVRWLEPEEAERLIDRAPTRLRPLVIFLLYTGCRISEAIELPWDRVNLSERLAYLPATKTGQARGVYLPDPVLVALASLQHRDGSVFGYASRYSVRSSWRLMCKRAGIADFTPHDCRHTWATWMRRYGGLDLLGLMEAGRWRDHKSVLRYTHVAPGEASRAADRLPYVQNPCTPAKREAK